MPTGTPEGMISFHCRCGQRIRQPENQAGVKVRCPRCKQGVVVPAASAAAPRPLVARPVEDDAAAPPAHDEAPPLSVQGPASPPPSARPAGMGALARTFEPEPAYAPPVEPEEPPPPAPPPPPPAAAPRHAVAPATPAPPAPVAAVPPKPPVPAPTAAPRQKRKHSSHPAPPSAARAVRPPPPRGQRATLQIILSLAVLSTIVAPWFLFRRPAGVSGLIRTPMSGWIMSWDVLSEAPGGVGAFLVAAWIIALAGGALGLLARGLARQTGNAALGLLGVIFFLSAGVDAVAPRGWTGGTSSIMVTLIGVFLPWLLVAGHARVRLGQSPATRVLLCGLGGAVAAFTLVLLIGLLRYFFDLPSGGRRGFILDLAWLVVCLMTVIGGCSLLIADGASRRLAPQRCSGAVGLLYAGLAFLALYLAVRPNFPAFTDGPANYHLLPLYVLLMLVLMGLLLCGGSLGMIGDAHAWWTTRRTPPAAPPPSA